MSPVRLIALAFCLAALVPDLRAEEEDQPSPVDLLLEQVSRDLKKLSRQFDNPESRDSSLGLADKLIEATGKARDMQPESAGERTGEELAKYMALYHQGMDALLVQFQALKKAIETEELGAAEAAIEESYALREKYHMELDVR